jgi:hypothetical protein
MQIARDLQKQHINYNTKGEIPQSIKEKKSKLQPQLPKCHKKSETNCSKENLLYGYRPCCKINGILSTSPSLLNAEIILSLT